MIDHDGAVNLFAPGSAHLDGFVSATAFLGSADNFLRALDQASRDRGAALGQIEWAITGVKIGSLQLISSPSSVGPEAMTYGRAAARDVILMTNAIAANADPTEFGSRRTAEFVERAAAYVSERGIAEIRITSGRMIASLTVENSRAIPRALSDQSIGSVEGRIVSISYVRSTPSFQIRHGLDDSLIACSFGEEMEERVVQALKRRVVVSGEVTTKVTGEVTAVHEVDWLYVFPLDSELPSVSDITGLDPELTEGMPSEVWVRRQRDS